MTFLGWKAIDFNWSPYGLGEAFFYGCRSYAWVKDTFIDAQPKVGWAAGNKNWSYPSLTPRDRLWPGGDPDAQVFFVGTESEGGNERNWYGFTRNFHNTSQRMHAINPQRQTTRVNYDGVHPIVDRSRFPPPWDTNRVGQ